MQEKQFCGHPKQLGSLFHRDWCGGCLGTGGVWRVDFVKL